MTTNKILLRIKECTDIFICSVTHQLLLRSYYVLGSVPETTMSKYNSEQTKYGFCPHERYFRENCAQK